MKTVQLPSKSKLEIDLAPFADSKALYQALLKEAKGVSLESTKQVANVLKDLFCMGFSSPEVEACLWKCFTRCQINAGKGAFKITEDTFEPAEMRGDYLTVCLEVAKENILPFVKSLYAEYGPMFRKILDDPKSK